MPNNTAFTGLIRGQPFHHTRPGRGHLAVRILCTDSGHHITAQSGPCLHKHGNVALAGTVPDVQRCAVRGQAAAKPIGHHRSQYATSWCGGIKSNLRPIFLNHLGDDCAMGGRVERFEQIVFNNINIICAGLDQCRSHRFDFFTGNHHANLGLKRIGQVACLTDQFEGSRVHLTAVMLSDNPHLAGITRLNCLHPRKQVVEGPFVQLRVNISKDFFLDCLVHISGIFYTQGF